jgi:hypothetical protein
MCFRNIFPIRNLVAPLLLHCFVAIPSGSAHAYKGIFFRNKLTRFRNSVLEYKIIHIKYNPNPTQTVSTLTTWPYSPTNHLYMYPK